MGIGRKRSCYSALREGLKWLEHCRTFVEIVVFTFGELSICLEGLNNSLFYRFPVSVHGGYISMEHVSITPQGSICGANWG